MAEWEINKPIGQCFGTGNAIDYGQEYYGALVETDQGLERRDYSVEFWDSQKPDVFCYWKSRLANPEQKKQIFVDDQMLMAFFERLENETEQEKINFRFVLALILMRKRLLKYNSTKTEGAIEIWTLKVTGENRTVDVLNPHLDEEQIEQLSSQIGRILQSDI
jgi:hypothetical protein